MKTKIKILAILLIISIESFGQANNLSVFDRQNGIVMQRALAIEFDETNKLFYYNKDDRNKQRHLEIRNYDLFNIKGTDNGKYILTVKFYNPLRVKFTFDEVLMEDPSIRDINNFIDKIPGDLYGLNKTFKTQNQTDLNVNKSIFEYYSGSYEFKTIESITSSKEGTKENKKEIKKIPSSIILSQWLYEFNKLPILNSTDEETKLVNNLLSSLNKIKVVDDYLYNEIEFIENKDTIKKSLSDWINQIQTDMYSQVSMESFKKQLDRSNDIRKKIEKQKSDAENNLDEFFVLITDGFTEKIKPIIKVDKVITTLAKPTDNFKEYSIAARQWISITIAGRKQLNDEAVKKLGEYIDKLNSFYNQFTSDGYKTLQTSQIDHKAEKIKEITISAVKLEKDGKEISDTKQKNIFMIERWNSAYPYISTGGFFTNFSFPEYSLNLDSTGASLINSSQKKLRFAPAIFLNFVFNAHNDYVYPVFQIGLGTINKSILMPIGLGFSITDRVTISGGVVPAFVKELDKLKVGDNVASQDVLDKDLSYKLISTVYFGVNINLNK